MDKQETEKVSNKDELIRSANRWDSSCKEVEIALTELKGKFDLLEQQGGDVSDAKAMRGLVETDLRIGQTIAWLMHFLADWISEIETQTNANNTVLIRLLGLGDNAKQREIEEAITDVGTIIGNARRRAKGGI